MLKGDPESQNTSVSLPAIIIVILGHSMELNVDCVFRSRSRITTVDTQFVFAFSGLFSVCLTNLVVCDRVIINGL